MTHYEPRPDPPPPPRDGAPAAVIAVVLLLAVCLVQCSSSSSAASFELHLPDGSVQQACGASYVPDAKLFAFEPCTQVFYDGFESQHAETEVRRR